MLSLGVVTRLIQHLLPNRQPHLPMAYPVSTDAQVTADNCFISAEGSESTHTVCPEAL
jgi:hypothetical protein